MRAFECKGCGTIVYLDNEEMEPMWCPICRIDMDEVDIEPVDPVEWVCKECGEKFYMEKGKTPYKCAFCNFTFPPSPHRIREERL